MNGRYAVVLMAFVLSCVLASGAFAEDPPPYTDGEVTVTWGSEPDGYLAIYDTTCASVSANYDPKFDDEEVERIQGDLTYSFDWSAGPGGEITNQDPAEPSTSNSSECDVGFNTASSTVDDKTVSVTCTVTGTIELIGPDGEWDTEDDEEIPLEDSGTVSPVAHLTVVKLDSFTIDSELPGASYDTNIPTNSSGTGLHTQAKAKVQIETSPDDVECTAALVLPQYCLVKIEGGYSTTIKEGETKYLEASPGNPGDYTLQIKLGDEVLDSKSGKVFFFKFQKTVVEDDAPQEECGDGTYAHPFPSRILVNADADDSSGQGHGAYITNNFKVKVITDPTEAYNGTVKASLKATLDKDIEVDIWEDDGNDGGTLALTLNLGFVSATWTYSGTDEIASTAYDSRIKFGAGDYSEFGEATYSSEDREVPGGAGSWDYSWRENHPQNKTDSVQNYVLDNTERAVAVGLCGHSKNTDHTVTRAYNAYYHCDTSFSEQDDTYEVIE